MLKKLLPIIMLAFVTACAAQQPAGTASGSTATPCSCCVKSGCCTSNQCQCCKEGQPSCCKGKSGKGSMCMKKIDSETSSEN